MRFKAAFLALVPLVGLLIAASAQAQIPVVVDTLSLVGRSAPEEGYLSLMNMDQLVIGPRQTAMGGAGLAVQGGSEYLTYNPAAIMGMTGVELQAEGTWMAGGAGVNNFPRLVDLGGNQFLDTSNYRVSPTSGFTYNSLSFGSPVVLFGARGAVSFSYTSVARTGRSVESRVEVVGPVTNNLESTYGLGRTTEEGMDALSASIARNFGFLDLGATLNWKSGSHRRTDDVGITVFGFQIFGSNTEYRQDVSSFNVDFGAQADLGKLRLGGSLFSGHTLKYSDGFSTVSPLPDPQDQSQQFLINYGLQNHSIEVPTQFGLGASYQVSDRLLVAADYWVRPWGGVTLERGTLEPIMGFEDIADSSTFFWSLAEGEGTEEVDLRYEDTNSLRFGVEYVAMQGENTRIPVRLGFRTEKLTRNNIMVPQEYTNQQDLILNYWRQLTAGDPDAAVSQEQLANLYEHNILMFQDTAIKTTVITFGGGYELNQFGVDLGFEVRSYSLRDFFLDDYDPLTNDLPPTVTDETRTEVNMAIGVRWIF